jgi:ATP-dependent Lhr-like helicase
LERLVIAVSYKDNPIEDWLKKKGWTLYDHQIATLNFIKQGFDVVLHAPTGGGKTIGGFMPSIYDFVNTNKKSQAFHTLYISPLKALTADVQRNLLNPINSLRLDIKVEARTSDTSAYNKEKQIKKPPNFLMTTPESFALLMARQDVIDLFKDLRFVIIDELHTFFNSKRGHLLSLNLARLRSIKPFRVIGLSATLKNTDLAKNYLSNNKDTKLVSTDSRVAPEITILKSVNRIPWSGHSPRYALPEIYSEIQKFKSSILFVNTRAQAEMLFESLWAINNKNKKIAIHHGSLEKELRKKVEKEIVEGHVECVVATSSLDLGLDWGNIDLVMQIGAPKGVSRLVQRIGRANHTIDTPSRAILVPTNCFEFIECVAAKQCADLNFFEDEKHSEGSLDVLAQHIVGVAISQKFKKEDLFKQIKEAWPYRNLNKEDFEKTLSFVVNGGYSLQGYEEYARLKSDGDYFKIKDKSLVTKYKMNIGTIVEAEMLRLRVGNRYLGNIEEWFVNGLSVGDTFIFAGKRLMFEKIVGNIAYAKITSLDHQKIPSFKGGNLPLSTHLSKTVRKIFSERLVGVDLPDSLKKWSELQAKFSSFPKESEFLVETFKRKNGKHEKYYLAVHPFEGRNTHQTLGFLILRRIKKLGVQPFGFVANDYSILFSFSKEIENIGFLFSQDILIEDLYEWLEETPLIKRLFREIAIISGLIYKNLPGNQKTGKQVTFNTDLIYEVLRKHEPHHILLKTTTENAKKDLVDLDRLSTFLFRIKNKIKINKLKRASALAFSLLFEYHKETPDKNELDDFYLEKLENELLEEVNAP